MSQANLQALISDLLDLTRFDKHMGGGCWRAGPRHHKSGCARHGFTNRTRDIVLVTDLVVRECQ